MRLMGGRHETCPNTTHDSDKPTDTMELLIKLVDFISAYPLSLFWVYLMALFAPRTFSWMGALVLAGLIGYGLMTHFETNYQFYATQMRNFGLVGAENSLINNPEYTKGIYHALSIALGLAVFFFGLYALRRRRKEPAAPRKT